MRFRDFIRQQGYRPFHGAVSASVYDYFHCPDSRKAQWFHKPGSFQCAGCAEQCETDSPTGFQLTMNLDGRDA